MTDGNSGLSTKTNENGTDAIDPSRDNIEKNEADGFEDKETVLQGLQAELQTVNKKILGRKTIKQCSTTQEIIAETRNSREILASTVLDLYNLCERAIDSINEQLYKPLKESNVQNKSNDACITQTSLESAIKAQLQDILPNAIKTALVSVQSEINIPNENTQPSDTKEPEIRNIFYLLRVRMMM